LPLIIYLHYDAETPAAGLFGVPANEAVPYLQVLANAIVTAIKDEMNLKFLLF
jgi:hypothetical protein